MNREEFDRTIYEYGIMPSNYGIYLDEKVGSPFSIGVYMDDACWVLYSINDRGQKKETRFEVEDEVYDTLYRELFARLRQNDVFNFSITNAVVTTEQKVVFDFLRKTYGMEEWELKKTWDYLMSDFRVLTEVKYYVLNNSFVPEEDAYIVKGYSAQMIYEATYLEAIGAYNYLIYLRNNPQKALADLKAGLPRK
ncbi:MAG: hypothetical protein J5525_12690 [Lachnospiraceae bacterium]|nr:hypothetical protein [Lachnospiraceae bacterium]